MPTSPSVHGSACGDLVRHRVREERQRDAEVPGDDVAEVVEVLR